MQPGYFPHIVSYIIKLSLDLLAQNVDCKTLDHMFIWGDNLICVGNLGLGGF